MFTGSSGWRSESDDSRDSGSRNGKGNKQYQRGPEKSQPISSRAGRKKKYRDRLGSDADWWSKEEKVREKKRYKSGLELGAVLKNFKR